MVTTALQPSTDDGHGKASFVGRRAACTLSSIHPSAAFTPAASPVLQFALLWILVQYELLKCAVHNRPNSKVTAI
jgi:hypothetical protein